MDMYKVGDWLVVRDEYLPVHSPQVSAFKVVELGEWDANVQPAGGTKFTLPYWWLSTCCVPIPTALAEALYE